MEKEKKEKIALFRFGVIAPLIGFKKTQRGFKEPLLREITSEQWNIPYSERSYISRSTILAWARRYGKSQNKLESLFPIDRSDKGRTKAMDTETELALINLKKELKDMSLPVLLKKAKARKILPADFSASNQTIYRIFKRHGLDKEKTKKEDMRRFEAELPNDLYQSDCMHGPDVIIEGKMKKVFLFAFIDDHSRIIPHAQFYPRENIECYMDCLQKAIVKRGIPRKLYIDNGPSFRSHHLEYVTASLGTALIHSRPYRPEGKGKIERFFLTVRMQFLPTLPSQITLTKLNEKLNDWIDKEYHVTNHSSISEAPLERYQRHLHLIKAAPKNINDYFRKRVLRTVGKDRTILLNCKVYEAPVGLICKKVTLLYHKDDQTRIEVFFDDKSYGFLKPCNPTINSRIKRDNRFTEIVPQKEACKDTPDNSKQTYTGGKLF